MAAGQLAQLGELELITAIDERSAAFLALGLATAEGHGVAVVTTSGTAVANLLPAAVEADRSAQPLLLLTADRPERLKNCGANQTVNQEEFLVSVCRCFRSGCTDGIHHQNADQLKALAGEIWEQAHGTAHAAPGPVQLNLPFEEPLHPSADDQTNLNAAPVLRSRKLAEASAPAVSPPQLDPHQPGLVVAGPWRGLTQDLPAYQQAVHRWMLATGWPLLADPLAALAQACPGRLDHWELQLDALPVPKDCQVLRLGPMPASRRLEACLQAHQGPQLLISEGEPRSLDPLGVATQWCGGMARWCEAQALPSPPLDRGWCAPAGDPATMLASALPLQGAVSEPALAYWLPQLLPAQLPVMLASSSPVRDWLAWGGQAASHRRCFGFRGASGIDGTLSLAMGLALASGPLVLVTGDLALLHDSNGWLHATPEGPPLLVVLIDNRGGGIFQQLPIASGQFEQLFAMPQRVDPLALAAAHGVQGRQVACLEDLPQALDWGLAQARPALLRLCSDRTRDAELRLTLRAAAQNEQPIS